MLRILENLRDPVAIVQDDRHLFVNQAHTALLGYTLAELEEKGSFLFLFSLRDRQRVLERIEARLAGEQLETPFEVELIAKDGRRVLCESTENIVEYDGKPAIFVTLRDRTKQHQLERTLALVTDNIQDLIACCDRGGLFSYVSPSYESTLGIAPSELIGRPVICLVHPDDLSALLELLQQAWTSEAVTATYRMRHTAGHYLWFETIGRVLFDEADKPDGAVFCTRDVTARRRAEEEREELERRLFQSQKMEAVGRLAGGIAHDFNNILTGIVGYLDLVEYGVGDHPEVHRDIAEIRRSTDRAASLVAQLLTFSRTRAAGQEILNLDQVVKRSLQLVERIIGADVVLSFRPAQEGQLWNVKADPAQLDQILVALATNARDALPNGGRFSISTRNVPAGSASAGLLQGSEQDWVLLEVSDDGTGIAVELRDHIFEPFFSLKEVGRGTGLGLATVYAIVKQHEGLIELTSAPTAGTTFTIALPRALGAVANEGRPPLAVLPPKGEGETILLVEDEGIIRALATRVLEREGYAVIAAQDAEEAYRLFAEHRGDVDLLLTDVIMPGDDGYTLYTTLREHRPELKVLFMSGYSESVVDPAQLGGERFLPKPFSTAALLSRVHDIIESDQGLPVS